MDRQDGGGARAPARGTAAGRRRSGAAVQTRAAVVRPAPRGPGPGAWPARAPARTAGPAGRCRGRFLRAGRCLRAPAPGSRARAAGRGVRRHVIPPCGVRTEEQSAESNLVVAPLPVDGTG
ncbi:hypothetical protein DEH18_12940 [Streptomyces sp. NHF165]|nr:hypothetical protein DEH18_12940 [Streptomyces sp. NHF165]